MLVDGCKGMWTDMDGKAAVIGAELSDTQDTDLNPELTTIVSLITGYIILLSPFSLALPLLYNISSR